MKYFKSFFRSVDVFAQPIPLTFCQERRFSTFAGGVLTFGLIALLVVIAMNKIDGVVNHKNVASSTTESIQSLPPPIRINNIFAFVFEPQVFNNLNGKVYFDYEVSLPIYTRLVNGTQIKDKSRKYSLSFCNSSHFPMFSEEQLQNYGIMNWICPNIPNNTDVIGDYNSPLYKFIQIKVSKCGTGIKRLETDLCASDSEISTMKDKNGGKIYLNLKYVNYLVNLDNFEQPLTPYFDQVNFLVDFPNTFIQKELSLTSVKILTDSSIFYTKSDYGVSDTLKGSIYEGKISELSLNTPQNEVGRINYVALYFKSNAKDKTFQRKYSTFQDVAQLIGSFWSLFFTLFGLINNLFVKYNFLVKLANKLYLFPQKQPTLPKNEKTELKTITDTKRSGLVKLFTIGSNNKKRIIKDLTSLQEKRSTQKYKLSYWAILKGLVKKDYNDYNVQDISKVASQNLDINEILKNKNELEKLKHILLTKEQVMLLNFSTKPSFDTANNEKSMTFLKNQVKLKEKQRKTATNVEKTDLFQQLFKNYQFMMRNQTEINKKIIELLDDEIKELFEKNNHGEALALVQHFTKNEKYSENTLNQGGEDEIPDEKMN